MNTKLSLQTFALIAVVILGGGGGKACARYFFQNQWIGLSSPFNSQTSIRQQNSESVAMQDINLGWIQTKLPFGVSRDYQLEQKLKQDVNKMAQNTFNTSEKLLADVVVYKGIDSKNTMGIFLSQACYSDDIVLDPKDMLAGSVANTLGKEKGKEAIKKAQYLEQNGSSRYDYQTITFIKGEEILYYTIVCTKGHKGITFFSLSKNNDSNKHILTNAINNTICFPQ